MFLIYWDSVRARIQQNYMHAYTHTTSQMCIHAHINTFETHILTTQVCRVTAKDLCMSSERSDAAPQQLQRRELTSNAARLTAVGAAAFSLVRPVLAAG